MPAPLSIPQVAAPARPGEAPRRLLSVLLATAFVTGLSSFIYEIAWIRMLSLVLGASTHSFELMLAAFILGLAAGGLWIRNRLDRVSDPVRYLAAVQIAMGLAAAATIPFYNGSFDFMAWLLSAVSRSSGGFVLFNLSSSAIALAVMLPATFCAGMTLPLITYRLLRSPTGERALGTVYAMNTLGSIIGVVIAVHVLMSLLGVRGALLVGAGIDVALGVMLLLYTRTPEARRIPWTAVTAVVLFAVMASAFDIDPRRSSSGVFRTGSARISSAESIAFHRDGKTATVDVIDYHTVRSIRTNGKSDAAITMPIDRPATSDEYTMALLALLPMGHQPRAETAAVIGFGSGMTTSILLGSPTLKRVDTIEIEPAMIEGARLFGPRVEAAFQDPRSRIVIDDAKSYFARGHNRYDIIVSEPSNPWVSGVASLFTEEFYRRLSNHMNDGAVLCQWLHTYEMNSATLASIFAAVSRTFPEFLVYSTVDSDIVLIARKGGPPGAFDGRVLASPALQPTLTRLALRDPEVVQRRLISSWRVLKAYFEAMGSPANSDFHPIVDQWASKTRFTHERVLEFSELNGSPIPLLEMLGAEPPPSPRRHVAAQATQVEVATTLAWALRDIVMGEDAQEPTGRLAVGYLAAHMVRHWITECPAGLTFEEVLPSLVSLAEDVNPRVDAETATKLWSTIAASKCASKLDPARKRWLELFEATARRDAKSMARLGLQILDTSRGTQNTASEYAYLSAITGVALLGDLRLALGLSLKRYEFWVRPGGPRTTEAQFLETTISASVPRSP